MESLTVVSEKSDTGTAAASRQGQGVLDLAPFRSMSDEELEERVARIKVRLGDELLILGHHYQQDEVYQFADLTGDSFKLSRMAAENAACRWIVFCGVHFMAETADILANSPANLKAREGRRVDVILPDLGAGCSMADMADLDQVENCWDEMSEAIDPDEVMPVTYINSAANLKAFCGERGGIVCTSSNAEAVIRWALQRRRRVLFFPDQHLGRNTAKRMGIPLEEMVLWDPYQPMGGNPDAAVEKARVLLWKGHCSVHQVFGAQHVDLFREKHPGIKILVHPECMMEVVDKADYVGSTEYILRNVREAPAGSKWAIGTELHLVNRLKNAHPDQEIHFLSPMVCMCATMYRIDLAHLCWSLENLERGTPVNLIRVPDTVAQGARLALERMLEVV
jgi:quinolinate synthase